MEDTQVPVGDVPAHADTTAPQTNEADLQEVTPPNANPSNEENAQVVNAEDTGSEKLYAGKYKTPEEMERAYQDLQSKFTSTSQEKAEISRILTEAFAQPDPVAQPTAVVDDDFGDSTPSAPPVNDAQTRDLAVMKFMMTHDNVDAKQLQTVLATDPYVSTMGTYESKLEYAYLRSREQQSAQTVAEATRNAGLQAQVKTVEKQAAQVEQANRSQQPNPAAERNERIRQGDPAAIASAIADLPAVQEMKRMAGLS
jgi:hypothetical protein